MGTTCPRGRCEDVVVGSRFSDSASLDQEQSTIVRSVIVFFKFFVFYPKKPDENRWRYANAI